MRKEKYYDYTFMEDGTIFNKNGAKINKRNNKDRYEVKLFIEGKPKIVLVHRIMYFLFNEKFDLCDKNMCVSAKDGNFLNLSLDNLILKPRKELIQGQHQKKSKLTNEQVEQIRSKYKKSCVNQHDKTDCYSYRNLADQYGVTYGLIAQIIRGEVRNEQNYKLK